MTAKEFNRRHKQKKPKRTPKQTSMRTGDGIPQVLETDKVGSAYVDDLTGRTYIFVKGRHWIGPDGAAVNGVAQRVNEAEEQARRERERLELRAESFGRVLGRAFSDRPRSLSHDAFYPTQSISGGMSAEQMRSMMEAQRQQILNMAATQPSPFPQYLDEATRTRLNAVLRQSNQSAAKKPEPKPRKDEAVSGAAGRVIRFEPET